MAVTVAVRMERDGIGDWEAHRLDAQSLGAFDAQGFRGALVS